MFFYDERHTDWIWHWIVSHPPRAFGCPIFHFLLILHVNSGYIARPIFFFFAVPDLIRN